MKKEHLLLNKHINRNSALISNIAVLHSETVKLAFGNDPGGTGEMWDDLSLLELVELSERGDITQSEAITLYYTAAAREEIRRKPFIEKARSLAKKESKNSIQYKRRELLRAAHHLNAGPLTNKQIHQIAERNHFNPKGMETLYRKIVDDLQKEFKKNKY